MNPTSMGAQNPPTEAGNCFPPPPFRFVQAATPTARCQGLKHPLTVLISVPFAQQRNGSGGSSLAVDVRRIDTFFFYNPWVFLIVAMGTSNCR
jgi:hypothetical protein